MTRPDDLTVIALSGKDSAQMATLHASAFPAGQAWDKAAFDDLMTQPSIAAYGVVTGDDLSAFILVQTALDQAEILTLATHPDRRRSGFGRGLIAAIERRLGDQGATSWLLDVAEDNPEAIAFYSTLGFRIDGRRPNYYKRLEGTRVDAILMSKPMAGQTIT